MAGKETTLRDLVESRAAEYNLPPRWLWGWALDAIVRHVLLPNLPEGISLDSLHGRIVGALYAIERGSDPSRWSWTSAIALSPAAFDRWLKKTLRGRKITTHPRRAVGAKSTLREDVAAFAAANYPSPLPPGITNEKIAQDYESKTGTAVSERTVRRALGRK